MKNWKTILKLERLTATPGDPFGSGQKYNLGRYYQGKFHLARPESGEAACLVRAKAVAYMLENLPLHFHPEQEFFGGAETFRCNELPPEISETEYQEALEAFYKHGHVRGFQAGWDHTAPDFERLMAEGIKGYLSRAEANTSTHTQAMRLVIRAVSAFFERAGKSCRATHPEASRRLCRLATEPPESFEEAIQLTWLLFVLLEADSRSHNALARFDQYLYPSYCRSAPSRDRALDLLCHLWVKIEGFHEVTNICIGGVKPDGSEAANELSLRMIEATALVRSASTNLSARIGQNTPEWFLRACAGLIATGTGFPAVFNDEVNIPMLEGLGIPLEAARDYALFGCVEPLVPGRQVAWSDGRFSLPECFLAAVMRLEECASYEELWKAFQEEARAGMRRYAENYNRLLAERDPEGWPDPFLSAFTRDCLGRGLDVNAGGAEFPRLHGVGMMGPATLADGLAAIKKLVYEEKKITPARLVKALKRNFEGEEALRKMILHDVPKYGNDEPYCDEIAAEVIRFCGELTLEPEFRTIDGGFILSCMGSNIQNIPAGAALGATPDGRLAGEPLSDAASPSGGRDCHGPTAFINSIVTPDYSKQVCTVVNMRFLPAMFEGEKGLDALVVYLKRFVAGGGQEMQFNVTHNAQLADAIANPEKYADLIVRVSGFSAFFTRLSPEVQRDIMRRNAHGA